MLLDSHFLPVHEYAVPGEFPPGLVEAALVSALLGLGVLELLLVPLYKGVTLEAPETPSEQFGLDLGGPGDCPVDAHQLAEG